MRGCWGARPGSAPCCRPRAWSRWSRPPGCCGRSWRRLRAPCGSGKSRTASATSPSGKKKTRDWLRPSKSWRERSPSRESGRRPTSRPCSSCGCRRTSCRGTCGTWRPNVGPRLTGSGSFQRKALYRLPGTPASNLLWEERLRDQTEKLLCQESGASGPRGRLPLRLRLAGQLFWALAKALFLALLGPLVLGPLCALLSHQPCPPPARPWLYMRPKEMQPP
ncbi:uncharacterized protein [Lepidochelys kempii]|uniref:uncharacterized protein isoform X8 n=1 Tax=Lepidochelys kempii TaxID=8472 RepID=UPI003C70147F